ncbi:MAG: histidine kinase [Balneolaceae bacterium]
MAQQIMPDRSFDQFRKDLQEAESPEEKLRKYLEGSVSFSSRIPDSVFILAAEINEMTDLDEEEKEAYQPFILANAWRVFNKDSVIFYAGQATNKLRAIGAHESYLRMENLLGLELTRKREYLKADSIFKNAISYSQTMEKVEYPIHFFYGNLGSLYSSVGAHDLAITMYEIMLKSEDNPGNRCNIISKLAVSLADINENQRAIKILTPCLEVNQLPPPIKSIVRSNLSRMYRDSGDLKASIHLMKEAANISSESRVPNLEVSQIIELGALYLKTGEISRADSVRDIIENISLRKFTPHFKINKNIFFGELEFVQGNYVQSIEYSSEAINTATKNNLNNMLENAYSVRGDAYEQLGELQKTVENERLQAKLDKEQYTQRMEKDIAMMKVRYQLQNKENELVMVSDELRTIKLQHALVFLLLVMLTLYILYKYRIHYLLKEEITKNKIAQDLHDDLSGTLSSISFFSEAAKRVTKTEDASSRYLQMIDKSAVEAKEKINDIIWAIDPANDDWSIFLKKCKRFAADNFDSKGIEYDINIGENFTAPMHLELRQNLWLIFKEMITNLVKHSTAENATVTFLQKDKTILLELTDNGIGFDTKKETDRHGIKNIKHRVELIGANAILESTQGKGTRWNVTLKI